jgi:hypothetical protein
VLGHAIRSGFASGINDLLIVTGIVALAGAVASFVLIRQKDFVDRAPHSFTGEPAEEQGAPTWT